MNAALHALFLRLHGSDSADAEAAAKELGGSRRGVVISACLLGEPTRYDGQGKLMPSVIAPLLGDPNVSILPLCPEVLGGMGCPRPAVHFADRTRLEVIDDNGHDFTLALDQGAARADELARLAGADAALLKERSPSCGSKQVHGPDGIMPGQGRFAERLEARGLVLGSEEEPLS